MSIAITPETKVGELLAAYPGIEHKLIEWVPAFKKLQNPVLRKTVTKLVTLEQAARVGGIPLPELLTLLRSETGQPAEIPATLRVIQPGEGDPAPSWFSEAMVRFDIEADRMLERGDHPLGKIREHLAEAAPGEIVRVQSSFHPAPLIDALRRQGFQVYSKETEPGRRLTYICRA
jgi:hypothetical protein